MGARAGPVDRAGAQRDAHTLAHDLGGLLALLRGVPADGGPGAGPHCAQRGGPLAHYADEARAGIETVPPAERNVLTAVLDEALASSWGGPPVWFHGDVAEDNLLLRGGRLATLLDFGCAGTGDPACDVVPAWTLVDRRERGVFRAALGVDDDTWARGRGWALWKAVITLDDPQRGAAARRTLARVAADR